MASCSIDWNEHFRCTEHRALSTETLYQRGSPTAFLFATGINEACFLVAPQQDCFCNNTFATTWKCMLPHKYQRSETFMSSAGRRWTAAGNLQFFGVHLNCAWTPSLHHLVNRPVKAQTIIAAASSQFSILLHISEISSPSNYKWVLKALAYNIAWATGNLWGGIWNTFWIWLVVITYTLDKFLSTRTQHT